MVFYKRHALLILHELLSFWLGTCCSYFFALFYYVSLRSEFCVVMSVTISVCSVHLYPPLFVGGLMSYFVICVCFVYNAI